VSRLRDGTRIALPSSAAAAVTNPTQITATPGVRFTGCTQPSRLSTKPRRPSANSSRLAATKFPLKTRNRESSAAARIRLTTQRERRRFQKATAVANFWWLSSGQGETYATTAIAIT